MLFDTARATSHYYVTLNPVKINSESSPRKDPKWVIPCTKSMAKGGGWRIAVYEEGIGLLYIRR